MTRITSPYSLAEQTEPAAISRRSVDNGTVDAQVDFRTNSGPAPDVQRTGHLSGAFAHALETIVAGASFFERTLLNAVTVVSYTYAKCPFAVGNLGVDAPGTSVTERVAKCFTRNTVHLIANNRVQISCGPLDQQMECRRVRCGKFLTERPHGLSQIIGRRATSQVIDGVASLSDRLIGTFKRLFQMGLGLPFGQEIV